jgi:Asp/Glu/hydantoin racemase
MLEEALHQSGLHVRSVGVYAVLRDMSDMEHLSKDDIASKLVAAARSACSKGADVLILGGAAFAGFEPDVRRALPHVELVDAMAAGVEVLAGLVRCRSKTARTGTYAAED